MYERGPAPYCYPGTSILKKRLGIRNQTQLEAFEALITAQRGEEPLPRGRLGYAHYLALHRHLFQDVFDWAGRLRSVRLTKGNSTFCYTEHIAAEMRKLFDHLADEHYLFGMISDEFSRRAAHLLDELNAIHPFREGNGRTQLAYLTMLAARAGHPLALDRMDAKEMLAAMIVSFEGEEEPLASLIRRLIEP